MLAGMLYGAGYHMGDRLLTATSSNPKGYFEDQAVNDVNEALLAQLTPVRPSGRRGRLYVWRLADGQRWRTTIDITSTVHATPDLAAQMRRIASQRPFCFKDPRFCYTIEAWRSVLGDAVFLCVFREPGRTAASMIADIRKETRFRFLHTSSRRALQTWTTMYEHVLAKHMNYGEWLFVHYDQIFDGSAIPRIEEFVGTRIDASFVDPSLKRSADSAAVPRRTAETYERLCDLADYHPVVGDRPSRAG
jgi:hypothetical protein